MCTIIEPEIIVAYCLRKKKQCSLSELLNVKRNIEKKDQSLYVAIRKDTLLSVAKSYSEWFTYVRGGESKSIKRTDSYTEEGIFKIFNQRIKENSAKTIKEVVDSLL